MEVPMNYENVKFFFNIFLPLNFIFGFFLISLSYNIWERTDIYRDQNEFWHEMKSEPLYIKFFCFILWPLAYDNIINSYSLPISYMEKNKYIFLMSIIGFGKIIYNFITASVINLFYLITIQILKRNIKSG